MKRYQVWGDNENCRAEDPNGEWVRYEDLEQAMGWDCNCDGGDQGDGLVSLPHLRTCPVFARQNCDCIANGNSDKPKQHSADPHAKNCRVYTAMALKGVQRG